VELQQQETDRERQEAAHLVCPALVCASTAFHTLLTHGQVASTIFTFLQKKQQRI
jgi:hypothetical protein